MKPRHRNRRLGYIALAAVGVGGAAVLVLSALQENLSYFRSPSDITAEDRSSGARIRLGGLVADGSVRSVGPLSVAFDVTDGAMVETVEYEGVLPDLFREGQGVIVVGAFGANGRFVANEVLAKHDENYVAPEVQDALERAGHPGAADAGS